MWVAFNHPFVIRLLLSCDNDAKRCCDVCCLLLSHRNRFAARVKRTKFEEEERNVNKFRKKKTFPKWVCFEGDNSRVMPSSWCKFRFAYHSQADTKSIRDLNQVEHTSRRDRSQRFLFYRKGVGAWIGLLVAVVGRLRWILFEIWRFWVLEKLEKSWNRWNPPSFERQFMKVHQKRFWSPLKELKTS